MSEVSHAYGVEVVLARNTDTGKFRIIFGGAVDEVKFTVRPGFEYIGHTHPGGGLVPSSFDFKAMEGIQMLTGQGKSHIFATVFQDEPWRAVNVIEYDASDGFHSLGEIHTIGVPWR